MLIFLFSCTNKTWEKEKGRIYLLLPYRWYKLTGRNSMWKLEKASCLGSESVLDLTQGHRMCVCVCVCARVHLSARWILVKRAVGRLTVDITYYGWHPAPFWPVRNVFAHVWSGKVSLTLRMRNMWFFISYLYRAQIFSCSCYFGVSVHREQIQLLILGSIYFLPQWGFTISGWMKSITLKVPFTFIILSWVGDRLTWIDKWLRQKGCS